MPRKTRPSKGQIGLLGDVYKYELKYQPHKETSHTGESVVVLRIPEGADELDIRAAQKMSRELAGGIKTAPNKFYRFKKPRHKE